MKTLIQFIKSIRLRQILTVFLAASLLVISTACGQGNIAQAGGKGYVDTAKRAMSDTYDEYDANQPFEGGMNGYNDDRRYNSETASKAKELVDTAKRRRKDNLGDYADSITDRAQDKLEEAKRDIPQALRARKNEAVEDIKQRTNTLKENVSNAPNEAKKAFNEATNTAQNALEDAAQATSNRAKDLKENFQDLS